MSIQEDILDSLLNQRNNVCKIPVSIKHFTEIAIRIIKEKTGVDVSKAIFCNFDEETYSIYTSLDENFLTHQQCIDLNNYSVHEDYLNTAYVLKDLFEGTEAKGLSIYTSIDEVDASLENDRNYICYIYTQQFSQTYKPKYMTVSIANVSDKAKLDLINFFFEQYYNTNQDTREFASEFYYIVNEIQTNNIPVTLNCMSDWNTEKSSSGYSFKELLEEHHLIKEYNKKITALNKNVAV